MNAQLRHQPTGPASFQAGVRAPAGAGEGRRRRRARRGRTEWQGLAPAPRHVLAAALAVQAGDEAMQARLHDLEGRRAHCSRCELLQHHRRRAPQEGRERQPPGPRRWPSSKTQCARSVKCNLSFYSIPPYHLTASSVVPHLLSAKRRPLLASSYLQQRARAGEAGGQGGQGSARGREAGRSRGAGSGSGRGAGSGQGAGSGRGNQEIRFEAAHARQRPPSAPILAFALGVTPARSRACTVLFLQFLMEVRKIASSPCLQYGPFLISNMSSSKPI